MKKPTSFLPVLALGLMLGTPVRALPQSVVVDEGTFTIEIDGRVVGTEEFSIRRAGFGINAAFIANGVITLRQAGVTSELRPLLRTTAPAGASDGYQLKVTGSAPLEITMNLAGPRFVSRFDSDAGQEEREFRARPDTRILDSHVAHHYYFLRDAPAGQGAPVIVPRDRRETTLGVGAPIDEELELGRNRIPASRVLFTDGATQCIVWYDRQGRVLRVEIPSQRYVASRRDLVG